MSLYSYSIILTPHRDWPFLVSWYRMLPSLSPTTIRSPLHAIQHTLLILSYKHYMRSHEITWDTNIIWTGSHILNLVTLNRHMVTRSIAVNKGDNLSWESCRSLVTICPFQSNIIVHSGCIRRLLCYSLQVTLRPLLSGWDELITHHTSYLLTTAGNIGFCEGSSFSRHKALASHNSSGLSAKTSTK